MSRRFLIPLLSLLLIAAGTYAAIQFAKGYRPNLQTRNIQGTGLLVANSFPPGAHVFINDKLTTATDDTLNLPPGEYDIAIKRDGYTPWNKHLSLKAELVSQTNATLFPSVPNLKPLTFSGAVNPIPSPDGQKIAYIVTFSSSPAQNGLWVLEMNGSPFVRDKDPKQISSTFWSQTQPPQFTWTPDSREVLVSLKDANYLLDATKFTETGNLRDVTARLPVLFSQWEQQLHRSELSRLLTLPDFMQQVATSSATNLYFSPDEQKLLYTATQNATIPENLLPDLPSESTQPQQRTLEPGATYVYDLKEDKNFRILDPAPAELGRDLNQKVKLVDVITPLSLIDTPASPSAHVKLQNNRSTTAIISALNAQYSPLFIQNIHWFPTSSHLIITEEGKIAIIEYDGTNKAIVFANAFESNFTYPWPNASQLVILTNLSQTSDLPPNLYSINLK